MLIVYRDLPPLDDKDTPQLQLSSAFTFLLTKEQSAGGSGEIKFLDPGAAPRVCVAQSPEELIQQQCWGLAAQKYRFWMRWIMTGPHGPRPRRRRPHKKKQKRSGAGGGSS